MYKQGKKINLTQKYTYQEAKKMAVEIAVKSELSVGQTICNLAIMAHIDTPEEASLDDFIKLFDKYVRDYAAGDFTEADLKKYNVAAVKELFKTK